MRKNSSFIRYDIINEGNLFMKYIKIDKEIARFSSKKILSHSTGFACLHGNDVVSGKISDHHLIVHDEVLFWNIMKQCNTRGNDGIDFNNGFGIIESDKDYMTRLVKVAQVIAEAVYREPSINVISICEGPIKPEHLQVFFQTLMSFKFMARFARFVMKDMFHKPTAPGQNWGLLMLADSRFVVRKVRYDAIENHPKLANRFQLWKLERTVI